MRLAKQKIIIFAHVVIVGFKSKRQKKVESIHRATEGYAATRRTRLNESRNVEHVHSELLNQGGRIEKLRADLIKKKPKKPS